MQGGAAAYLGIFFLVVGTLVSFLAAGQANAIREEEARGFADQLLVRPVSRIRWLTGRLAIAVALVVAGALAAGVAAFIGAATQHSGIALVRALEAGVNVIAPSLVILGVAVLTYGWLPRATSLVSYGVVGWSFIIELLGTLTSALAWLRYTSVFHYIKPVPAANIDGVSAAVMLAIAVVAGAFGVWAFNRRDITGL